MAGRKVLVQDDGTGHMAYVDDVVTTGTSEARPIYVGDVDPAIDHLADLLSGDVWIDTTGGVPYQQKSRDVANDGWDIASMVLKDGSGDALARVDITPDGTVSLNGGFDLDPGLLVNIYISPDGSAGIINGAVAGSPQVKVGTDGGLLISNGNANITVGADGAWYLSGFFTLTQSAAGDLSFDGASVNLPNLPTADPAVAGALWADSLVVKVSAG